MAAPDFSSMTPAQLASWYYTEIESYKAAVAQAAATPNPQWDQFQAWLNGTAAGGPNGDGRYPLTNLSGTTNLVLCPAAIAATAASSGAQSTPITASYIASLPIADPTQDNAPGILMRVGDMKGGFLLKQLQFFPSRQTIDLQPVQKALATDLLQIARNGSAYQLPLSAIQQLATGVVNVKDPIYGAKGDYRETRDGVVQGGSGCYTVTSASNPWVAGQDEGKLIFIGGGATRYQGTISQVVNKGQVTVSVQMTTGLNKVTVGWGTDDTAAIKAAIAAAAPPTGGAYVYGGVVLFPPGYYLTDPQYQPARTAFVGYGGRQCAMVRKPSTSTLPLLSNQYSTDDFPTILNLGLYGAKTLQPANVLARGYYYGGAAGSVVLPQYGPFPYWDGMWVWETTQDGFVQAGQGSGTLLGLSVFQCAHIGYKSAAYDMDCNGLYIQSCSDCGFWEGAGGQNNNYANMKVSFNGTNPDYTTDSGCNYYLGGGGGAFTNCRGQESYWDNWIIAGSNYTINKGRAEDTGDTRIQEGLGNLPGNHSRAAVRFYGSAAYDNDVDIYVVHTIPSGHSQNCATHAVRFDGGSSSQPVNNYGRIVCAANMRTDGSYWQGGNDSTGVNVPITTGVYAPGVVGTDSAIDPSNHNLLVNFTNVV